MPKISTLPTLYDEVLQLSISMLKEWKYLNIEYIKSGKITWKSNGKITDSILISVNTYGEQPYIRLNYKYKDEQRNYKVRLVSELSNLGKGFIWYFLCPQTNKRCRKLYSIGGYFFHRDAFSGCMYEIQTRSKYFRQINNTIGLHFKIDDLYRQIYQKHFKKTYASKPTKKYLKLINEIEKAERRSIKNPYISVRVVF
jgi:hypothetical protein|tara:strand:+ start:86 stop:679 length:594 start_codon:yes stop_codon:yes gene_type:complete